MKHSVNATIPQLLDTENATKMPVDQNKPSRKPGTLHYDILKEIVVYCPVTMQAASLNESARVIWELCDGTRTVGDIATGLAAEVGIPADEMHGDVTQVVTRLLQLELLTTGAG